MANHIEYAQVLQKELDKAAVEQSTTGWMELNDRLIRYDGGAEVKVPKLDMDGLADYDKNEGFVDGAVTLTWQTKEMTNDRGRRFVIDENDVNMTGFVLSASTVMGEFQRTKVLPEMDAYRYSTISTWAIDNGQATGGYTPNESTILKKLYYDIAAVQDVVGDSTPLVITMATKVAAILSMSDNISKKLDTTDFKQGDVTMKVKSLDGEHPIIRAGSARMKTAFFFKDGKSTNQATGGFEPASDAKSINWIICPRTAPMAVSRTDKMRIFDPETYQKARAWAMDYRRFHDLWLLANALPSLRVNVEQALS